MTNHLEVLLHGQHIGEVNRTRSGALRLDYSTAAQVSTPLSLSMPPHEGSHTGQKVERFLDGLTPQSVSAMDALTRKHGINVNDPMSILSVLGKDCAGAVQFCSSEDLDNLVNREGWLEPTTEAEIEMRLSAMSVDREASWHMEDEHWSLGGSNQKFALRRENKKWHIAHGAEPTTHIVKPGIWKIKAQALVEHVSMDAANRLGLDVAESEYSDFISERAIVITRYDRTRTTSGSLDRVHQEDMCQALGTDKHMERFGGPSAAEIMTIIRQQSSTAREERANATKFADGLIFNTVIGAPDAHARNYSVILDGESVRLAPLYDVSTELAYTKGADVTRSMAMSIGGTYDQAEVSTEQWKRLAEDLELDEQTVLDRVSELAEGVPAAFKSSLEDIDDWDGSASEVKRRLIGNITEHCRRVSPSTSPPDAPGPVAAAENP